MANETENKIKLEDITFEDMIGEGLEESPVEEVKEEKAPEAVLEDKTLDEDIEEKKEEVEEEKEVVELKSNKEVKESEEVETEDGTIISEIASNFGYDLEGEYDDTPEGLTEMTKELAGKVAEGQLDKIFEAYPEVQKHLEYVMNGGDSRNFITSTNTIKDLEEFKLTKDNINSQQAIMAEYLKAKGHEDEFISDLLNDYMDGNKLYEKSVKAKQALIKYQKDINEKEMKAQEERLAKEQAGRTEFWNGVRDTISTNKEFKGFTIQEKDKSKFFDFLSKPVEKDGSTARDKAYTEADTETKLAIDYLLFKGFDIKSIVATKAKTKASKDLRSRLKSSSNKIKSAKKGVRTSSGNFDVDDLDLDLGNLS